VIEPEGTRPDTSSPLLGVHAGRWGATRAAIRLAPRAPQPIPHVDGLLAGAAEVDITPPPGMPKAGYSRNAHDGSGFRTRLRARVLHLRSGTASLALVQLDLLGGSALLQHLVAQAVATDTDVPIEGLLVGATHTHAGPGHYLSTNFYNRFATNRVGFDPAWTQFLVERIADGVRDAVAQRRAARLAFGSTEVWGLTRNRSLPPHVQNAEVTDERLDPQRKFVSVNPWLHLLRVDAEVGGLATEPLGAMVVFSVHGTGIPMRAHEYNADLWAYLVGELAHRVEQRHGVRPVVGAVEGTHADVAPALRPGMAGHVEAARVGRAIGADAATLYERLGAELRGDVTLAAGLRELDLRTDRTIDGVTLPRRPAVGAALLAGAHENVTPVVHRIPPFRAGTRKPWRTRHPQGAKWVIGTRWLQPLVLRLDDFPRVLPVQVLRIGDAAVVGLPFEVTVASGRRIEAAALDALRASGVERVVVSSVANEYFGYVATREEYELQHYEGGHTIYGPSTQAFLAAHTGRLAAEVGSLDGSGSVRDVLPERQVELKVRTYLTDHAAAVADAAREHVPREVLEPARFRDPTPREDALWELVWRDVAPAALQWHAPLVRVEACDGDPTDAVAWVPARARDGRLVDDQTWDIEVQHLGPAHDGVGHRYAVRWHDPTFRAGRRHRFVLCANAERPELITPPFD
jgi:neutral ceramidase